MRFLRRFALAILLLSITACATNAPPSIPQGANDIWPKIYTDETYMFDFSSSLSEEAAIGTIRNLQNSFVEYTADMPVSDLSVDAYGLRAKWTWIEGGTYVKSAGFIIPFDQVSSILLQRYPASDKAFKWGLNVYIKGTSPAQIRTASRDAAERLGRSIFALAAARGASISMPNPGFGAALSTLTADQAKAAVIPQNGGLIVAWVFKESPAERAGFSPQDIITGIGGSAVAKMEDFFGALDAAQASGAREVKIQGLRRSYRMEGEKYIEEFVPVTFTLSFGAVGVNK